MKEIKINITKEQWNHIQELIKTHNITQEQAIRFLFTVGMREKKFMEEFE